MQSKHLFPVFTLCMALSANLSAANHEIDLSLSVIGQSNSTSPEDVLKDVKNIIVEAIGAIDEADRSTGQSQLLSDFSAVDKASETEQATFYNALSAKRSAINSNITRKNPATVNVIAIGKRLSVLRNQTRRSSFRPSRKTKSRHRGSYPLPYLFNQNDDNVAGGLLDQRLSGFITANFILAKQSDTATEPGFKGSTQQLTVGADYRLNRKTFAGLALGLNKGGLDFEKNGGDLNNKAITLLSYGSYNIQPNWYIDATVSRGLRYFDMSRTILFTLSNASVNTTANSEPESSFYGFSIGSGYNKSFSNGHSLAALASFNYSASKIDSFCEGSCDNNPLAYSLIIDDQNITSKMITIGGQWSQTISTGFGVLIPQLSINWVRELENKSDAINAFFSNDPSKTNMSFRSGNRDLNFVNIKFAVSVVLPRGWSGFFHYQTQQFVDDYQEYAIAIGGRKEF